MDCDARCCLLMLLLMTTMLRMLMLMLMLPARLLLLPPPPLFASIMRMPRHTRCTATALRPAPARYFLAT